MSEKFIYRSCFQPYIDALIKEKRLAGYRYESEEYTLYSFDSFCVDKAISEPIVTRELMNLWGSKLPTEGVSRQGSRISVIRQLSIYMQAYGIDGYIPRSFSHKSKNAAYILNDDEVTAFFKRLDAYYPACTRNDLHRLALEYKVLFRMIFCCGLRISEARKLSSEDVDLEKGILRIRQSKGNNERIVYMLDDLKELCQKYWKVLNGHFRVDSEHFFPARQTDRILGVSSIEVQFQKFWKKTPYASNYSVHPTVHSLRHTYVVKRMNLWMAEGVDLQSMMPYLSRYLGHTSADETFYYYHLVESAHRIIKDKDTASLLVIPDVEEDSDEE